METLENKITNVSNDCSLEDWDYLEMIWHPLMLDLPDAICEGNRIRRGHGVPQHRATNTAKASKSLRRLAPANGTKIDILAFLMQLNFSMMFCFIADPIAKNDR